MFNAGVRGKRAKDSTGFITVGEHFNQQTFLVPTVTRFAITDGSYVDTNDTAADPAGNQVIVLYGSGFAPGATVLVGSTTIGAVTFLDSGRLTFSSPALGSGSYTVFVTNANGGTGILVPGLVYSGVPTFTTAAGSLGTVYETTAISTTVVATGDAPITYALSSGSLPSGSTLSSGGTISGTAPVDGSSTTYSFTVQATDAQNQDSVRSFSLTINTDVVSFSSPANNTTTSATQNLPISNVTVVATSAAGYGVLYTSSGLPTGLSMNTSTGIISGTPTVVASNTSIITATANTTSRTATRYLNWTINLPGDLFWKYASLLMSANPVPNGNTFNTDLSTFNNEVVVVADTKPNEFHPFKEGYYSNYFDGTGDYLAILTNAAFNIGTNSFTVEAWINTSSATQQSIFNISDTASSGYGAVRVQVLSDQTVQWLMGPGGSWGVAVTAGSITLGTWNHIAITRNGSSVYFFINGLQVGTTQTYATSLTTGGTTYIGYNSGTAFGFNGYISNLRFINGTALYTANTTLSTSPLTYVANTSLLTCQSNKLIDNSNNNFTILKGGDTKVNPFSPFNGTPTTVTVPAANNYSMYFDGTGDYLTIPSNSAFAFGTGDFTIEFWVYPNSGANQGIFQQSDTAGGFKASAANSLALNIFTSNAITVYAVNTTHTTSTNKLIFNTWTHLALVRASGVTKLYINGVLETSIGSSGSITDTTNYTGTHVVLGGYYSTSYLWIGYISNYRIVKGTAVYTGNFTVPTSPLAITQSSSANTAALIAVPTNGSSMYFDGTGDYLSVPGNAAFQFTADFTVECWVYLEKVTGYQVIVGQYPGFNVWGWMLQMNNGSTMRAIFNNSVSTGAISASATLAANQWYHVALTRSGTGITLWFNGTSVGTSTLSGNIGTVTDAVWIGNGGSADYVQGYISNLRVIRGTAVYTTTFTPSTTPLTAVTNTSLLTCQSKTSTVIDNSTNAFTITKVGDAAVANTFSPFGTTASFLTAQANTVIDNSSNALTITTNGNAGPARNGPFANTTTVTLVGNEGSAYFDGTGDCLGAESSNGILPADFTVEMWVYLTSSIANQPLVAFGTEVSGRFALLTNASGQLKYGIFGDATEYIYTTIAMVLNTWTHVAFSRTGTNMYAFINGASAGAVRTLSGSRGNGTRISVGASAARDSSMTGYLSNVRVVNGTGLYTSAFVPSWAPLTPVANTVLLTAQTNLSSNTKVIVDESNINSVVTGFGNTNLGSFSPFGSSWSAYFDGANDFLSIPTSSSFNFGTGDFTVECWVNWSSTTTDRGIISRYAGASSGWALRYDNTSGPTLNWINGDTSILIASHTPIAGTWYHYAVCRSGTTLRIFINGTQSASTTYSGNQDTSSTLYIGQLSNTLWPVNGYISNVRILKGTALYTAAFTPSTNPLLPVANTILLTCNSNRFVDYSAANNVITKGGDGASTVSKFSPFSSVTVTPASYSGYFDGTGDYLTVASSSAFNISGNFTVEGWYYFTAFPGAGTNDNLWTFSGVTTYNPYLYLWGDGTITLRTAQTSGTVVSVTHNFGLNIWYHIAVVKSSTNFTLYVNGTSVGTGTSSAIVSENKSLEIGGQSTFGLTGYLSNFRVVNGTAVYTSNFTPSTTPLTAIANTSLLTCQSTTFIDNSNNAFAITVNGNAKPVIQNPFTDTVSDATNYSANTFGNSVYFDGTGDYASYTASLLIAGTFTAECWFYNTSTSGVQQTLFAFNSTSGAYASVRVDCDGGNASNQMQAVLSTTGSAWNTNIGVNNAYVKGVWNHVAVTRDSSNLVRFFVNGVVIGTATQTGTLYNTSTIHGIGTAALPGAISGPFQGYISNLRMTNGQALYTGPFVPSNRPAPVTSNTTLLLASTVGPSVTDALRISNIETFGTSRYVANNSPYYDTYSAYFDGTGDYLTIPPNSNLALGTGDFTVEWWYYPLDSGTTRYLLDIYDNNSSGRFLVQQNTNMSIGFYGASAATRTVSTANALIKDTWNHIAICRNSGITRIFSNGVQVNTNYSDSGNYTFTLTFLYFGTQNASGTNNAFGHCSNFRIVKGTGLYTSAFTPPTAPLTAIANTSLLTCQSNRFIDNSTNAFTITKAGDAKITTLEPFVGSNNSRFSSVYFATKTDYLAVRPQPSLIVFPGDFTFECWVYPTDATITRWRFWDSRQAGATGAAMNLGLSPLASAVSGSYRMEYYNATAYFGTITVYTNQWTHLAYVRSGTTMTFYVNGVAGGTATISGTQTGTATTAPIYIGSKDGSLSGYGTLGYIADLRITNGYARTITVPTAPYDIK